MLSLKMSQEESTSGKGKEALMHTFLAMAISSISACHAYATETLRRTI